CDIGHLISAQHTNLQINNIMEMGGSIFSFFYFFNQTPRNTFTRGFFLNSESYPLMPEQGLSRLFTIDLLLTKEKTLVQDHELTAYTFFSIQYGSTSDEITFWAVDEQHIIPKNMIHHTECAFMGLRTK
ncbi:hypothetical protein ACJX0J_026200, partial [Zea mays]